MSEISRRKAVKVAAIGTAAIAVTSLAGEAKAQEKRGSGGRGRVFKAEAVAALQKKVQALGKIRDWCEFGQPGIDGVCGRFVVSRDRFRDLAALILDEEFRPNFEIFPEGTPVPDLFDVRMKAGNV